MDKILITGCAGFIGSQFSKKALKNYNVVGIDNLDNYYSTKLKIKRLKELKKNKRFIFFKIDIQNKKKLENVIKKNKFKYVFHFAAQAGVRYSIINPEKYTLTNILGTINLLNSLRHKNVKKIFLSSSSSVYGEQKKFPLAENMEIKPINHYAFTKKVNEITGKYFSDLNNMNIYILRFFTVYGQWGRPDMFFFKLFKSFHSKKKFKLNNNGNHERDLTHIDDVCEILFRLIKAKIKKKFDIFNICSNKPVNIKKIVNFINSNLFKINIQNEPRNILDVRKTHGNNKKVLKIVNYKKFHNYKDALIRLYDWYSKNKIYKY